MSGGSGSMLAAINKIKELASLRRKHGFGLVAPKHRTNRNFNKDAVKVPSEEESAALRASISRLSRKELKKNLVFFVMVLVFFLIGVYFFWNWFNSVEWFKE